MKNIQIITGARNCVYDIFCSSDEEFEMIFPNGTNIGFIDEILDGENRADLDKIFDKIWDRPVKKSEANGIHAIIFYGMDYKKEYYPNRVDEDEINPNGSKMRSNRR